MDMKQAIQRVADRQDLTGEEAGEVMELLLTGAATQAQIGAFLTGLRMKGETIDEIAGLASVLADKAEHIHPHSDHYIDLVGTGGDCTYSFNISTPFPISIRSRDTIRPTISTFAAPRTFGTVSSMDFPEVVTSSIITTRSPSCSLLPRKLPLSAPWSFSSLRSEQ